MILASVDMLLVGQAEFSGGGELTMAGCVCRLEWIEFVEI